MEVYEAIFTTYIKRDIYYQNVQAEIGRFINKSMLLDEGLKELHKEVEYKPYSYSGLYPVEFKTKRYKGGNVYVFRIRSISENFIEKLNQCLKKTYDTGLQIISSEIISKKLDIIHEMYSITPVIVTKNNSPWLQNDDLDLFIERLTVNLVKKYRKFIGEDILEENFIQALEFTNKKPIVTNYKNIKLLGNKVKMEIKPDENSQKLAQVAYALALGEKGSSIGGGFTMVRYV